jgi:hypothetical protein
VCAIGGPKPFEPLCKHLYVTSKAIRQLLNGVVKADVVKKALNSDPSYAEGRSSVRTVSKEENKEAAQNGNCI